MAIVLPLKKRKYSHLVFCDVKPELVAPNEMTCHPNEGYSALPEIERNDMAAKNRKIKLLEQIKGNYERALFKERKALIEANKTIQELRAQKLRDISTINTLVNRVQEFEGGVIH